MRVFWGLPGVPGAPLGPASPLSPWRPREPGKPGAQTHIFVSLVDLLVYVCVCVCVISTHNITIYLSLLMHLVVNNFTVFVLLCET